MEILRKKEIGNTQERLQLKFDRNMVDPRSSKREYLLQVWDDRKMTTFHDNMAKTSRVFGQGVIDQVQAFLN